MTRMRIGVLGAGKVGLSLGRAWVAAGHEVVVGVRRQPAAAGSYPNLREASLADAVATGDVVVVAVPGIALDEVLTALGSKLAGKLVIDATNRIDRQPMNSLDRYDQLAPEAIVYRAFNSLGFQIFEKPMFGATAADHLYCGPDVEQRATIETLINDIGLSPIYLGGLDQVAVLEACTQLYFALAKLHGRHVAIKILHDR